MKRLEPRMNARSGLLLLCGLAASGAGLIAQEAPAGAPARLERIRRLNARLLPSSRASEADAERIRADLAARSAELRALIVEDPAAALAIAFPPDLSERLRVLLPASESSIEEWGRWQGTADSVVMDDFEGNRSSQRRKLLIGGRWEELYLAGPAPADSTCGRVLEVEGLRLGGKVAAREAAAVTASEPAGCSPRGEQRIAVFLLNFPGTPLPAAPTPEVLEDALFGAGPTSLRAFWQENSQGKASVLGRVFPWRTLDRTYGCDEHEELWEAVLRAVDGEVNFREYNRIFLVFPKPAGCAWAGLASVGCRKLATGDGPADASIAWLVADYMKTKKAAVMLAAHEGGHNLGLLHASARSFGAEPLGPPGEPGLVLEYGDSFSAMGYWNPGHYNARQKQQLGWWGEGEIFAVSEPGAYSLAPASSGLAGAKALRIQRDGTSGGAVWLEARQPVGAFDRELNPQVFSGALVHYEDELSGARSDLLDFTRTTEGFEDPALRAGQDWQDPYSDLKLAVHAASQTGLSVSVARGSPPCVKRPPGLTLTPAHQIVESSTVASYTLTLRNNDSPGCPQADFTLAASTDDGRPVAFPVTALSVDPGSSATARLTMEAGAEPGTYEAAVRVSRDGNAINAKVYCSVFPPDEGEEATVWSVPLQPAFQPPGTIAFRIRARTGGKPVYPGTAAVVLFRPDGTIYYRSVTLRQDGTADWSYTSCPERDGPGEYAVKTVLTSPTRAEAWSSVTVLPAR